jgi:hypothetical protein
MGEPTGFQDQGKLVDDHLLVFSSAGWLNFEVFDLNTGKQTDLYGYTGPNKGSVNNGKERMPLLLEDL